MCGLFGVVDAPPGLLNAARVARLLTLLRHRGPDDRGWLSLEHGRIGTGSDPEDLAGEVVLLHTRLSILDLSAAGHQPMSTPDGRFHLSFNGEIYNYVELRSELEALGRKFVSGTDTEVLLAAWAEWGTATLERLVGMFAFSLVDAERRILILARDHFGIKPLYYAPLPGRLAFASEIPPLLELPGVGRRGNAQRAYDYLRFGRIDHGAETMFEGVRQLQPAHYAELPLDAPARMVERPYWRLKPEPVDGLSLDAAAGRLRELFLDNVRIHLRSDVPVGAAFSGGIDSSANVSAMRFLSGEELDLHTFSFVPSDPELSEERWITLVSNETRATLHTVTPTAQELQADLDDLISVQGEPFGSTSIYAQYRVFRLTREAGVKVMLDGQGADELFAGYRHYLPARLSGLVGSGRLPAATRLLWALRSLPGANAARIASWAVGAALPSAAQAPIRRLAGRPLVPSWLDAGWLAERGVGLGDPWRDAGGTSLRAQRLVSVESTLRTLLRYEDRNSMASSVESRVPFLTPALAEFAAGLPDDYLIAPDGTGKLVLRRSLRGLVPGPVLDRRDKIGFATPETDWLLTLGPWIESVLGSPAAETTGPLRLSRVRERWEAARAGSNPLDTAAWRWLNFIRWADRFTVQLD